MAQHLSSLQYLDSMNTQVKILIPSVNVFIDCINVYLHRKIKLLEMNELKIGLG